MNGLILHAGSLFGAGFLTSLTPCVYPMIPITVGYLGQGDRHKKAKVLGFVLGQITAFTTLGVVAVSLGEVLGFSSELPSVQIGTGLLLILMAIFSFRGKLPSFLGKWNNKIHKSESIQNNSNVAQAFLKALAIGIISSLVASPCTSPVLGGVLASIAQADSLFQGTFMMLMFSCGMSLIFLFLGLGLVKASKLPRSGAWLSKVHHLSTGLLSLGGGYFLLKGLGLY